MRTLVEKAAPTKWYEEGCVLQHVAPTELFYIFLRKNLHGLQWKQETKANLHFLNMKKAASSTKSIAITKLSSVLTARCLNYQREAVKRWGARCG